jgi:2-methylisocitrate lyase-like PEP mutase family enzyme
MKNSFWRSQETGFTKRREDNMAEKKTTILKKRIKTEKGLWNPLCYDCVSAKIFDKAGADLIAVSGYGISMSLLGLPDMGFISLTELAMVTRYVVDSVDAPVIADADTGFGNALNVLRTTREIIKTGAAAMLLEDQLAPKRCGHMAGKQVIPVGEAVGKYRAAVEVRNELDPDFIIVARTDARGALGGGLEEAISRANAYLEAGADVAFVEGLLSEDEIADAVRRVNGPIVYNMIGISPIIPIPRLIELGVSIIGFGNAQWAATKAMWDYAQDLKKRGMEAQMDYLRGMKGHPLEEFHDFAGFPQMKAMEEKFLPKDEVEQKYKGTLGYNPL